MKRLYIILFCFLIIAQATAQDKKKRKPNAAYNKQNDENEKFLNKQWWLGFKAGTNLTTIHVLKTYTNISPTNYSTDRSAKQYESFKQPGAQATLEASFYYEKFYFSFQPTYQHANFTYTNDYSWEEDGIVMFEQHNDQNQKVDHLILPLLVKYDITGNKLRPYVQIGVYSSILLNANKYLTVSENNYASGGKETITKPADIIGAKDLFAKNHWGLIGGGGLNYALGNVRINLDVQYRFGMSNITSTENRNENDSQGSLGDVLDDMTMDNLAISMGALFPLRFLASGFKSLDR